MKNFFESMFRSNESGKEAELERELAGIEKEMEGERAYLENVGGFSGNRDARVAEDFEPGVASIVAASREKLAALEARKAEIDAELGTLKQAA